MANLSTIARRPGVNQMQPGDKVVLDFTNTDPAELERWLSAPQPKAQRVPWLSAETVLLMVTLLSVMALGAAKIAGLL